MKPKYMTSILAQFIKWLRSDFIVCVCVCPRLILHAHPAAERANLLNAPHELLAPSSSGWSLSTHRCHHSRHLNTWPHPWRRQGRGWFGDPPFCQKRHVWAWEHCRISSKTANTNNKRGKKGRLLIIPLVILSSKSKWTIIALLGTTEWQRSCH